MCRPLGRGWTLTAGFISGLLAGSIGAGGPPVIIYSTLCPWDKDRSKGTLAIFFLISGIVVASTHAASGLTTAEVVHLFLISLPALALGILGGTFAYGRISDRDARRLALYLVLALGCLMVWRNL
ncbi:sulfite exporter TauE/SafE family protein [Pseudodesulfovibrio sp.]|uniref:sulfite exporter TauE/SafE family protein n=1 Tax=Pseudodesulfovibrio sp. TaxID=2035812 RepID=UPI0026187EE7|nr:sulfite exporter TauE/SafE family protein [Pseudodesulfovibrio sp.]MDD3313717.1 sulfite exporter TauE/SafE family protein [Pseudodesulfovibrio sp.]